jgi:hypothetical protein
MGKVEDITQRVLRNGVNLKYLTCEGKMGQLEELSKWQQVPLEDNGGKVKKMIDVCEFS